MPHDPNNSIYRFHTERRKGIVASVIFHAVLIVFLFVAGFSFNPPEGEEGLLVNFGMDDSGFGEIEPSTPSYQEPEASQPVPRPPLTSPETAINTQEHEEAAAVKKVTQTDPEAEKKRLEEMELEKIRLAELEAERKKLEQEELERKKKEEEERRLKEIADQTRNALVAAQNKGSDSKSEGVKPGTIGNQGVETGSVDSKVRGEGSGLGSEGFGYDLGGRKHVGKFPEPVYKVQEEGRVVVEIFVDRNGKVIEARPGVKGTTIQSEELFRLARESALKAVFEVNQDAPIRQTGTITYYFKLK